MPARTKWTLASLQVYLVRAGSHEVDLGLWTLSTPARTKSTFAFISISLEVHFVRARPQEVNLWPSSAASLKVDFVCARSHKVDLGLHQQILGSGLCARPFARSQPFPPKVTL